MAESVEVDLLPFPHGFFTRRGGVSTGPFASLNCSLSGPDNPDAVLENRGLVADSLGVARDRLLGCTQVHGIDVAEVTMPWAAGEGPRADAMVTRIPGMALGIVTADCAPILFADPAAGVVGAAHAGWRGAVAGVIEATLRAMMVLGAQKNQIKAAVGPCIGQESYEVASDLRDAVIAGAPGNARFFVDGDRSAAQLARRLPLTWTGSGSSGWKQMSNGLMPSALRRSREVITYGAGQWPDCISLRSPTAVFTTHFLS